MKSLGEFTKEFTDEEIPYKQVGDTLYLPGRAPELDAPLVYMTTRLGEQRRAGFKPSIALLDILKPLTHRKAVVTDDAAWLFLCGKNVLKESIVNCSVKEGHVLVMNLRQEVLGYGKITGAGITNKLDRGDFLRREK